MIKRRKVVADTICSSSVGGNVTVPLPSHQMVIRKSVSGSPAAVITLSANKLFALPLPKKDDIFYTLRELVIYLSPFHGKGIRRMAKELRKNKRCLCSATAIVRYINDYRFNKSLPCEDDFGDVRGAKPFVQTHIICKNLNDKEHMNMSYVGDGLDESKEALTQSRKRRAEGAGLDIACLEDYEPCDNTIANYDAFATLIDPDITMVNTNSARKKSISREVMSRSIRSLFTHAVTSLLSGFVHGKWENKPKNLSQGAEIAHQVMEKAFNISMTPRGGHLIINTDDTGRFVSEGAGTKAIDKKRKVGKTSTDSTARDVRKVSSLWTQAKDNDKMCNGVKCKFKVLVSASGHIAPIVLHFYGMPDVDLSVPFVELVVNGLSIGGEVKPGCMDVGHVIMTTRSKKDGIVDDVSGSENSMKWYHEDIVIPFQAKLKEMEEKGDVYMIECSDTQEVRSILKLDSEVSYLNYLRRQEIMTLNREKGIDIVKIGGGSTESSQALDLGDSFKDLSSTMDQLTMKNDTSVLKRKITKILLECKEFTCKSTTRKNAMVDAVCIAPEAYRKSFTKSKIQASFARSGENTKVGKDRYITCPDVDSMRKMCKITWTEDMKEWFNSKLVDGVTEMSRNGFISEAWLDAQKFPMDTTVNGIDVPKVCTLNQLHLHRHMILNHDQMQNYFNECQEQETQKKQEKENQKYRIAKTCLASNQEAESKLKKFVSKKASDGTMIVDWNALQMKDFFKLNAALILAFVRVRKQQDLVGTMDELLPTQKGTMDKVENEEIADDAKSIYLIKWAYDCKDSPVIAIDPGTPQQITIEPVAFPIRLRITERQCIQSSFEVSPDFIASACMNFASLEDRGENFVETHKVNAHKLNPDIFAKILMSRLPGNLKSRGATSIDHFVWDFMYHNAKLGAAILKLHGCPLSDSALKRQTSKASLFNNSFIKNLECLSGRPDSVLNGVDDQLGAYMYDDEDGLGIVRAGSAAVGLRKRHKDHVTASRQRNNCDEWSRFYSAYPDEDSNGTLKGTIGKFSQLRQITGVRFKKSMKAQVIGMFAWDERTTDILNNKKVAGASNLNEKKHRMVCYFFEKLFDLMMGLDDNLSSNPGFESFAGNWNRAKDV